MTTTLVADLPIAPIEIKEIKFAPSMSQSIDRNLAKNVQNLFALAKNIVFEDGMDNEFLHRLVQLVNTQGIAAIQAIEETIHQNQINPEIVAVTFRYLGEINHPASSTKRFSLLINGLTDSSPTVRDGAALGLAAFDDPVAIPFLEKAIAREPVHDLREDMQLVLAQLKESR